MSSVQVRHTQRRADERSSLSQASQTYPKTLLWVRWGDWIGAPHVKTRIREVMAKDRKLCSGNSVSLCWKETIYNWRLWKLNMIRFSGCAMMGREAVLAGLNYGKFWSRPEHVWEPGDRELLRVVSRKLTVAWRGIRFWRTTWRLKGGEIAGRGPWNVPRW